MGDGKIRNKDEYFKTLFALYEDDIAYDIHLQTLLVCHTMKEGVYQERSEMFWLLIIQLVFIVEVL